MRAFLRAVRRAAGWLLRIGLLLVLLRYSSLPLGDPAAAIAQQARDHLFEYGVWMVEALAAKAQHALFGAHPFLDEPTRSRIVRDYMADLASARTLEGRIEFIYADSHIQNPAQATAELRAERDALRASLSARQSLVESILEGQTAAVLVEEGFGVAGQLVPPISMRFTQPPSLLVISPRDRIELLYGFAVDALTADEQNALETAIEQAQDVSALIVPLGGIALYPAMILERASIPASLETFAHEWLHHYLLMYPLGFDYDLAPETRIINETTAVLFGREIGGRVLARYYPDLAAASAPLAPHTVMTALRLPAFQAETPFDFGAEMHETRVTVDALLETGAFETAEQYMESRRRRFVANGYIIRRLNQAYFAFYGGYQSGTPGAGGSDPTGAAVQRLRDTSPSIHAWIVTMRGITTRDQLLALAEAVSS